MQEAILNQLAERHRISTPFVKEILTAKNLLSFASESQDADDFSVKIGDQWKYTSYALSTNLRAENSLGRMLSLEVPSHRGKALDVGCGYGGFLSAFGKQGFEAHGIEIDPHLAKLARMNLTDASFVHQIFEGDLFGEGPRLGTYDLITMNDVLEHLPDPIFAFNHLAKMLNPGGMLAIYMPNGLSIFNVTADPHNRVCGASAMPYNLASSWVRTVTRSNGYGLGEYISLESLQDLSQRNGLAFKYKPHDGGERPENARVYLKNLVDVFSSANLFQQKDQILAREAESAIWSYISKYSEGAVSGAFGKNYCHFNDTYLSRAWTITCKKPG